MRALSTREGFFRAIRCSRAGAKLEKRKNRLPVRGSERLDTEIALQYRTCKARGYCRCYRQDQFVVARQRKWVLYNRFFFRTVCSQGIQPARNGGALKVSLMRVSIFHTGRSISNDRSCLLFDRNYSENIHIIVSFFCMCKVFYRC